jgi:hypothetical protein
MLISLMLASSSAGIFHKGFRHYFTVAQLVTLHIPHCRLQPFIVLQKVTLLSPSVEMLHRQNWTVTFLAQSPDSLLGVSAGLIAGGLWWVDWEWLEIHGRGWLVASWSLTHAWYRNLILRQPWPSNELFHTGFGLVTVFKFIQVPDLKSGISHTHKAVIHYYGVLVECWLAGENQSYVKKELPQCYIVHHKSHMSALGLDLGLCFPNVVMSELWPYLFLFVFIYRHTLIFWDLHCRYVQIFCTVNHIWESEWSQAWASCEK